MLKKIKILLLKKQRKNYIYLYFASIIVSIFELISIGSIPIFVMIIIDINILKSKLPSFVDQSLFDQFSQNQIALLSAIVLTLIFIFKNVCVTLLLYWQSKITLDVRTSIRLRLLKSYMGAPYAFYLLKNPAELVRSLNTDVDNSTSVILSFIILFKETLLLIMIFVLLFYSDPFVSVSVLLFLTTFLGIFFLLTKKKLNSIGEVTKYLGGIRIKIFNHGFGAIKDIKLLSKETYFIEKLKRNLYTENKQLILKYILIALPRPFLEVISVMTVVIVATIFVFMDRSTASIIPIMSLLAVSIVRLIPAFSKLSIAIASIKTFTPSFDQVTKEIFESENTNIVLDQAKETEIKFSKNIYLKKVNFRYPNTNTYSIIDLSLAIKPGKKIGFIGSSGSGKSTLINLLMGLLEPTNGKILIDDKDISINLRSWQSQLGYVPQDIYLLDDTIRNNIAFGFDENNINAQYVSNAIRSAQLENFINSLPDGEETIIGNRGIRLSGGQNQRIGIARALYNNPKVLILDEATSSLDTENEQKIMNEIFSFSHSKTLIIITHRHQAVQNCDNIFLLDKGKLIDQGKYDYLNSKHNLNHFIKKKNV